MIFHCSTNIKVLHDCVTDEIKCEKFENHLHLVISAVCHSQPISRRMFFNFLKKPFFQMFLCAFSRFTLIIISVRSGLLLLITLEIIKLIHLTVSSDMLLAYRQFCMPMAFTINLS